MDQPVAEKTTFGRTVMGPGKNESQINYFANTSQENYQKLYSLDVLGLQESNDENLNVVHEEFKESLQRKPDGSYINCLPWKLSVIVLKPVHRYSHFCTMSSSKIACALLVYLFNGSSEKSLMKASFLNFFSCRINLNLG